MKINVRVEFECTPIRHIAVQCPHCDNWFYGHDLVEKWDDLRYSYQIDSANYHCPLCNEDFGRYSDGRYNNDCEFDINEGLDSNDIYKDCKTRKVSWE